MRLAQIKWKQALMALALGVVMASAMAAAQQAAPAAKPAPAASQPSGGKLPTIWHSEASNKDFRVKIEGDVFHAEWVNLPPAAAKQGAYMRIDCRRTGTKWAGSASVYQGFADPAASAGKEVRKMCHLTTRFEVDSITAEKIAFHTEALRDFDFSKCQVLKTAWEEFVWFPKK